jgi:hypothetical protein
MLLLVPLAAAQEATSSEADATQSGAVGGALAGWGAVPVATEEQRTGGLLHVWSQIQTWATLVDQDVSAQADPATYGDPEADPGFSIHRARLGVDGFVPMGALGGRHQVDYALSVGVGAPYDALSPVDHDVQLVDGFGRWAVPQGAGTTSVAVGLQRVPFSRENGISSAYLPFQEGAVSTAWMAPARGVGAVAGQSVKLGDGKELLARFGALDTGDLLGQGAPDLLVDARLELSIGDTYKTYSPTLDNALGVGVAAYVHQQPGLRTRAAEADLLARYKVVTLLAEVLANEITPVDTDVVMPGVLADTDRFGWLLQLSGYVPLREVEAAGVEIAVRASSYDDATAIDDAGDVLLLHAGATLRNVLPKVDVGAGYVHRAETFSEVDNDSVRMWFQFRPDFRL